MSLEKVKEYFKGTGIDNRIIELDQSSATVALAAKALKCSDDKIAKSLSFILKGQPAIIVVSGLSKIDNAKYRAAFGEKAKMIPFDDVEKLTGHAPGGVCPFALKEGVKVYLDESLKKHEQVYPAAGSGNSAVLMTIPELEKYSTSSGWVNVTKKIEL